MISLTLVGHCFDVGTRSVLPPDLRPALSLTRASLEFTGILSPGISRITQGFKKDIQGSPGLTTIPESKRARPTGDTICACFGKMGEAPYFCLGAPHLQPSYDSNKLRWSYTTK
eukprot:1390550-Amorphochlora_amoeboformis.AAC.1